MNKKYIIYSYCFYPQFETMEENLRDKLNTLISIKERCQLLKQYLKKSTTTLKTPNLSQETHFNLNRITSYLKDNIQLQRIKYIIKNENYRNNIYKNYKNINLPTTQYLNIFDIENNYWDKLEKEIFLEFNFIENNKFLINKITVYSIWLNDIYYMHNEKDIENKTEEIKNFMKNGKLDKNKLLLYSYVLDIRPVEFISFYSKINKKITKWTKEEDILLINAVEENGESWKIVSKYLENRTYLQCRERYKNHLDKNIKKCKWTDEEDLILLELCKDYLIEEGSDGRKSGWADIAKKIKYRTDMQCRKRYFQLNKK
ncbi:Myb-like DNA-binding domain protein [Spraguea lophii 42_110]|uniref:Myb-like DNA-binding domain protein n=1 Tax=Spraguea lophii (strain 42_110) TaxID=1358809 RepID=S7WAJ1_SPRLO|nr:Myb-like DNA-binding domain protein [Spraguea lophii 42_110]